MSDVIRSPFQAASQEADYQTRQGWLFVQPALRNDADAITPAIARLKEDLRGGRDDGRPEGRLQHSVHSSRACQ